MSHYSVGVPTCSHRSSALWKREPHSGNRSLVSAETAVSEHGERDGTLKDLNLSDGYGAKEESESVPGGR